MRSVIQTPAFKNIFWTLTVVVLFLAVLPTFWLAPQGDEAMYLLQSKLIEDGWLPYKDFFQFIPPVSLYFGALVLKLTGNSVFALRFAVIALQLSGLYALLTVIGDRLQPFLRLFFILFVWTGCISMSSGLSHHSLGGAIVPWILFFTVGEKPSPKMAGFLCSLLVLTSQVLGILVISAALFSLWDQNKGIKSFFVFFLPLPVVFVLHLLFSDSFTNFLQAMIWLLQGHYAQTTTFGYFITGLNSLKATMITWTPDRDWVVLWGNWPLAMMVLLIGLLPVAGLIFGALVSKKDETLTRCLFYFALATVISTFSYSSEYHISQVAWPALLLGVMAFQAAFGKKILLHQVLTTLLLVTIAGTIFHRLLFLPVALQDKASWIPSYGTRENQFWLPEQPQRINTVRTVVQALHTIPKNQSIFIWNASPELYLFSDRMPATRYLFVLPGLMSDGQMTEILNTLKTLPPHLLIYDSLMDRIGSGDPRYKNQANLTLPTLEAFVQSRYSILFSGGGYTIFVLNTPQN